MYKITLHDPSTGVTKTVEDRFKYGSEEAFLYQWLEGDYRCDCNRKAFMYDDVDYDCGESVKLMKIERYDGTLVEIGDDESD